MTTKEELLAKADQPNKDAMRLHPYYRGKIQVMPRCRIKDVSDFAIWYTPGVAKPCLDIHANPETVFKHTTKWNTVGVITDGTRVLGLGDIGPEASLPVMEGKAILFKYLGGVDAFPIALDTKDPDEFIKTVLQLQPTFGGFNLEDISQPKCFPILDTLRKKARIPVWHDDQQGTAAVTVAGLINALKIVGKKMHEVKVTLVGAGAANIRIAHMCFVAGVDPKNVIMLDSKGTLHTGRDDLETRYPEKWEIAKMTNEKGLAGDIPDAMKGADVLIALSKQGPDTIKKEWIATMAKDAVVFTCANPIPEIWPWEAKEAGARIVATGRSDFPNQVNNSLGFPGIFRGVLDVMATTITDTMCVAASRALAAYAEDKGMHEDYLIPTMDQADVYAKEAVALGLQAQKEGVARISAGPDELFARADAIIKHAREEMHTLMDAGLIVDADTHPEPPIWSRD